VGDRFGEGGGDRAEKGAGRGGGGTLFLQGGGRVVGADLCGETVDGAADAGLESAGLTPGRVVRTAGRSGELGADGVGEPGGGGFEGVGKGFDDREIGEGGGGLAGSLGRDGAASRDVGVCMDKN